ncbi:MAG: hypothetical protein ACRCTQ_04635 [Brevinemataceae bacterium]
MNISNIITIVDVIASIILLFLLILITIRQNQKLEEFQEKQDEQAKINRLKEYILHIENKNKEENFVLIKTSMMFYTDMIALFVAHFNKMSPDIQDQDRYLYHYCFNRLIEITNIVRRMMEEFDLINQMYYEYETLVPALRSTFDMSTAVFDFFESTVIYGLGKTSQEDLLKF